MGSLPDNHLLLVRFRIAVHGTIHKGVEEIDDDSGQSSAVCGALIVVFSSAIIGFLLGPLVVKSVGESRRVNSAKAVKDNRSGFWRGQGSCCYPVLLRITDEVRQEEDGLEAERSQALVVLRAKEVVNVGLLHILRLTTNRADHRFHLRLRIARTNYLLLRFFAIEVDFQVGQIRFYRHATGIHFFRVFFGGKVLVAVGELDRRAQRSLRIAERTEVGRWHFRPILGDEIFCLYFCLAGISL